jgi:hypothetical protein
VAKINLIGVASTPDEHERGLQFVRSLSADTGMLFQFKSPRVLSFWMMGTYIPLDIAFANKDGIIVKTERMVPLSLRTVSSGGPCVMALEVPAGTLQRAGIKAGDKMTISQDGKTVIIGE